MLRMLFLNRIKRFKAASSVVLALRPVRSGTMSTMCPRTAVSLSLSTFTYNILYRYKYTITVIDVSSWHNILTSSHSKWTMVKSCPISSAFHHYKVDPGEKKYLRGDMVVTAVPHNYICVCEGSMACTVKPNFIFIST